MKHIIYEPLSHTGCHYPNHQTTEIMREHKYRGKRIDNGEWVYGYYVSDPETTLMPYAIYSDRKFHKVIPETVGQFNEMDNNHEGDIVKIEWTRESRGGYLQSSDAYVEHCQIAKAEWKRRSFAYIKPNGIEMSIPNGSTITVIGNIIDNPELLK
jgi:hypothetical protein